MDKLRYLQIEIGRHCSFMELAGVEPAYFDEGVCKVEI